MDRRHAQHLERILRPGGAGRLQSTKTANRVAGAFSFVLRADTATGATGTRNIAEGKFDLAF
jgi:hypothetical protein